MARNDLFQGLVKMIANVALDAGPDVEKILAARIGDRTVADAIAETVAKVGENMTLRRAAGLSVGKGAVAGYMHNSPVEGLGRIGVIVTLESTGNTDELKTFGRLLAMHIAAANPQAIDPSGLDPATIEREKGVLAAKAEGKPANVLDKIVESGLRTFYKEVCLLSSRATPSKRERRLWRRPSRRPRPGLPRRSGSAALCALRSAKESTGRPEISVEKSPLSPARRV